MRHLFWVIGAAVLMTGCGSAVKLDTVPVEDKAGVVVSQSGQSGQNGESTAIAKSGVSPVDMGNSSLQVIAPTFPKIVYFEYDSIVIKPEFQAAIEAHARFIKQDKARKVALEGHTDERGGREYNLALGQKRAEAVKNALSLLGVPEAQLEAVSFGKEKPAVSGTDESAMSKNRRAEINYR
jgi:peptidoglycan-associated lipoprotein